MSKQARLGLLVLAGVVLFVLALFIIANRSFLLDSTYTFYVEFNRVGGLGAGHDVQYQGLSIGRVEDVALPTGSDAPIRITLAIRSEARSLVRHGAIVQIVREGIIGEPMILLDTGNGAEVQAGDVLQGTDPLDLMDITNKALASVAHFDSVATILYDIAVPVRAGEGTIGRLLADPTAYHSLIQTADMASRTLNELRQQTQMLTASALQTTEGINAIIQSVQTGEGTITQLLNDRQLYDDLLEMSRHLQTMTQEMQTLMTQAEQAIGWGNVAAFRAAENMEALKHNWLLKGYFERRGYYEKAPFEIREKAIVESYEALNQKQQELQAWEQRLKAKETELITRLEPADTTQVKQDANRQEPR